MRERLRAARVIAQREAFEALISPGLFIAIAAGLFVGYALCAGFARSIDSSGFNPQLRPLYGLIARALTGAFGAAYVDRLFAQGPLAFSLALSFVPVFLYLTVSSVFKLGLEKNAGAVELLAYGPADGTSYFVASYARDLLLSLGSILVLFLFHLAAAAVYNLSVGGDFLVTALVAFFLSLAITAYGILATLVTQNPSSSIALFIAVHVFFLAILLGSYSMVTEYVRSLSSALAWTVGWISPFFYANMSLAALAAGDALGCAGGLLLLAALSAAILFASHFVAMARGVRA